jgi:uncharacterized alkaline shock family protein YloU
VTLEINLSGGRLTIAPEVLAIMAGVSATECYGIVGMASRKIKDGIAELLGRDNLSRGVEVKIEGNTIRVRLYIVVGYGTRISEVANNVMEKVKYTLQEATGVEVSRVEIYVQGVKVGEHQ